MSLYTYAKHASKALSLPRQNDSGFGDTIQHVEVRHRDTILKVSYPFAFLCNGRNEQEDARDRTNNTVPYDMAYSINYTWSTCVSFELYKSLAHYFICTAGPTIAAVCLLIRCLRAVLFLSFGLMGYLCFVRRVRRVCPLYR